jgi:hypothetical protein
MVTSVVDALNRVGVLLHAAPLPEALLDAPVK